MRDRRVCRGLLEDVGRGWSRSQVDELVVFRPWQPRLDAAVGAPNARAFGDHGNFQSHVSLLVFQEVSPHLPFSFLNTWKRRRDMWSYSAEIFPVFTSPCDRAYGENPPDTA